MFYMTLDLETTGTNVQKDVPIQMAWIVRDEKDKVKEQRVFLIKPSGLVSSFIENLTGITNERLRERGCLPETACKRYTSAVWNFQPLVLIGYNLINFDLPMLQNFLFRFGKGNFKFPPITAIADVMFMMRDYSGQRKWPKLAEAAESLGIEFEKEKLHDALVDVELTWKVFAELRRRNCLPW